MSRNVDFSTATLASDVFSSPDTANINKKNADVPEVLLNYDCLRNERRNVPHKEEA